MCSCGQVRAARIVRTGSAEGIECGSGSSTALTAALPDGASRERKGKGRAAHRPRPGGLPITCLRRGVWGDRTEFNREPDKPRCRCQKATCRDFATWSAELTRTLANSHLHQSRCADSKAAASKPKSELLADVEIGPAWLNEPLTQMQGRISYDWLRQRHPARVCRHRAVSECAELNR